MNIEHCYTIDQLIDMIRCELVPAHLVECYDCGSRYKGLCVSYSMALRESPDLRKSQFKQSRLAELDLLAKEYGDDSLAIDMAIKTAFSYQEACIIYRDLGLDLMNIDKHTR